MLKGYFRLFPISLLIFLAPANAPTDQITLLNGDRISGEILYISGNEIQVSTEYAGEITIDFSNVTDLRTSKVARISLKNGDTMTGQIALLASVG